jgi:HEAT repeat protein/WD40 repeat protein
MRVPASWTGRKKKCRRCGVVLIFGAGVVPDGSGVRPGLNTDLDEELEVLIQELVRQVEQHPEQSALNSKVSRRVLSKIEQQLKVTDPLSRDDAIRRRAAVIELGKTHDVRAIEILSQAQHDSWEAVRQGVAAALGELADPSGLPIVLTLLMDSHAEVVRDAIGALREIGDPRTVPILLMFGQRDAALRLQAREAVVGMGSEAVEKLIEIAQGRNETLVREAVVALGRIRDSRAVHPLLSTLDRSSGPVRVAVVEALGRIADARAVGPLIGLLDDPEEEIQISAANALVQTPDARAVRPLTGILLQTQNVDLRKQAIRALAATKDPRGVPAIARLIDHADVSLRETIAEGLGTIGDTAACQPLVRLLRSDSHPVLLKAISALRRVATDDAVEALIPLVQHPNPSIRRQTIEVLGDLRPPDAFDLFAELLAEDVSFEVRAAAAKGLGKLKDKHGIRLLEQALRDEPSVRCAALMGLTAIGEQSAIPALLATLRDPTPVVRYHAVTGLGKLKAEQATGAIRRLLEDKDSMVRTGAEKALVELGISNPQISLQRRLAVRMSGLMPDNLVGIVPGGVATMIAVPCMVAALGIGWFLLGSTMPPSEFELTQILFATPDVSDVTWFEESAKAAVLRTDGTVDVWNAETDSFVERLKLGKRVGIARQATAHSGIAVLFTIGKSSEIGLWNLNEETDSANQIEWTSFNSRIQSAATSSDGKVLLAVTGMKESVLWDVGSNSELAKIEFQSRPHPVMSSDGRVVAGLVRKGFDPRSAPAGETVLSFISTETGEPLAEVTPDFLPGIQELLFASQGQRLFAKTNDRLATLTLDDKGTVDVGEPVEIPPVRNLRNVSETEVSGVRGSNIEFLNVIDGKSRLLSITDSSGMASADLQFATVSADGKRLLLCGEESKSAWILDVTTGKQVELSPLDIPESVRAAE